MLCVQGEVPQMRHHTRGAADRISVLVCVHDSSHERPPCCGEFGGGDRDRRKCVTGVLGGIREMPRGRRRGCGWYAPKRIAPTGAVFQPGRPNADFTTMMPVERQGGNADFFSN